MAVKNYDHCLHFHVVDKRMTLAEGSMNEVVSDNFGNICIRIDFDEQWDGVGKTARFIYGGQYIDVVLDSDNECICPCEVVKKGRFELGVFGADLKATTPVIVNVAASIISESGSEMPPDPQDDVYTQLLKICVEARDEAEAATQAAQEAADIMTSSTQALIDSAKACQDATAACEASNELATEAIDEAKEATTNAENATRRATTAAHRAEGAANGVFTIETNSGTELKFWVGTQAEYDAIKEKVQGCFYIISDDKLFEELVRKVDTHLTESVVYAGSMALADQYMIARFKLIPDESFARYCVNVGGSYVFYEMYKAINGYGHMERVEYEDRYYRSVSAYNFNNWVKF